MKINISSKNETCRSGCRIDEPPNVMQKTQLSLILVIVASRFMFPLNICKFFLHEKLIKMPGTYSSHLSLKSLILLAYKYIIPSHFN